MKRNFLIISLILLGAYSVQAKPQKQAKPDTQKPQKAVTEAPRLLFKHVLGDKAKPKTLNATITCEIKSSDLDEAQLTQVEKNMALVEPEPLQEAFHMVATIPSVEIWAYIHQKGQPPKEYLLYYDYETLKFKPSHEANFLVDLVQKTCSPKEP